MDLIFHSAFDKLPKINYLAFCWYAVTSAIAVSAVFSLYLPEFIPKRVVDAFSFGKHMKKKPIRLITNLNPLDVIYSTITCDNSHVPKKWFVHFYVFAVSFQLLIFFLYLVNDLLPSATHVVINFVFGREFENVKSVERNTVLLVFGLAVFHFCRRFYETAFICIFGRTTIDVSHYVAGFVFYGSVGLSFLNLLLPVGTSIKDNVSGVIMAIGFFLFVLGSCIQHQSFVILRKLRTNKGDKIINNKHHIPQGGMFEYISSPHYFGEILIYVSFYLMTNYDSSFQALLYWVIVNQTVCAILSHRWYLSEFDDYPQTRKIVIPFIF